MKNIFLLKGYRFRYNKLVEEALHEAIEIKYNKAETRMVRAKHLIAIMLQTYRPKGREILLLILDEIQIDTPYLDGVLKRHWLLKKWNEFRRRYDEE